MKCHRRKDSDGGITKPARTSGGGSHLLSGTASKAIRVALASGMLITRPELQCEIAPLCARCCCRYTTEHVQKRKGSCFVLTGLGMCENGSPV